MRRDSKKAQAIDRLLIGHGILEEGSSIGRLLEDWSGEDLLPEPGLSEEDRAMHYRALLHLTQHGKSYDRVAFELLKEGYPSERARSILVDLYGALAAVRIPRLSRGADNSPSEDAAFAKAERIASSKIAVAFSDQCPHPDLFAPLIRRAEQNLADAASRLGETPGQILRSANTQLIWYWMGGDLWSLPPLFSTVDPELSERTAELEQTDPTVVDEARVIYEESAAVLTPRKLLDYVRDASLSELSRAMAQARLLIAGERRRGLAWTEEEADLAAFMQAGVAGLSLRSFATTMQNLANRLGVPWDEEAEAKCEDLVLNWDEALRRYAEGEPPPVESDS